MREPWPVLFGLSVENSNGGPSRISMLRKKSSMKRYFARKKCGAGDFFRARRNSVTGGPITNQSFSRWLSSSQSDSLPFASTRFLRSFPSHGTLVLRVVLLLWSRHYIRGPSSTPRRVCPSKDSLSFPRLSSCRGHSLLQECAFR